MQLSRALNFAPLRKVSMNSPKAFLLLLLLPLLTVPNHAQKSNNNNGRCRSVFKAAASLNVTVDFAKLEVDRSRYDFNKFIVSFPEDIDDIFACRGPRRLTLRYGNVSQKTEKAKEWEKQ